MEKLKTSGEELLDNLFTMSHAGAALIHLRAKEIARLFKVVRDGITVKGLECNTWNVATGDYTMTTEDLQDIVIRKGDNNPDIIGHLNNLFIKTEVEEDDDEEKEEPSPIYHVYVNAERWFEDPSIQYVLQQLARDLPTTHHRVLFITEDAPLPESVADLMVSIPMSTPTYDEVVESYNYLIEGFQDTYMDDIDINEEGKSRICRAGSGLTVEEFESFLSEAFVRTNKSITDRKINHNDILMYLNKAKTNIVNQSNLLELYPAESIDNVGGLSNVKEWVEKRKNCYSEEAKDLGIEPPKGILLTGLSGTGKGILARSIANLLGVGLLKLDIGKMYSSYVGSSENRIRSALKLAEDLAPVVLFCVDGKTSVKLWDGSSCAIKTLYEMYINNIPLPIFKGIDTETLNYKPIKANKIIRSKGRPMIKISTTTGYIKVSEDHRLLASLHKEKPQWTQASKLTVDHYLVNV